MLFDNIREEIALKGDLKITFSDFIIFENLNRSKLLLEKFMDFVHADLILLFLI